MPSHPLFPEVITFTVFLDTDSYDINEGIPRTLIPLLGIGRYGHDSLLLTQFDPNF